MEWIAILTLAVWIGICSADRTERAANATITISQSAQPCQPGTSWWDDCNACRCAPDRTIRCTKINCSEFRSGQTLSDMPSSGSDTPQEQDPCLCPDGSLRRCLKGGCPTVSPDQTSVKVPFYPETWPWWCQNSCYSPCAIRRCPVMNTPPAPPPQHPGNLRRARCTPGVAFRNDCNTCRCNMDGESAMCSDYKCVKKDEDQRRIWVTCVPGYVFKTRCYSCQCEDSGKIAVCTRSSCDTIN